MNFIEVYKRTRHKISAVKMITLARRFKKISGNKTMASSFYTSKLLEVLTNCFKNILNNNQ